MPARTHKTTSLKDEALSAPGNHIISILSTQDGFSFVVYDKDRNKFLAAESYNFETQDRSGARRFVDNHICTMLKVLVDESELMTAFSKQKGYFIFAPNQSTEIPLAFFNEQEKESYIRLNFGEIIGDVFYEINSQTETVCVYSLHKTTLDSLQQLFPNTECHPLQNVLSSHFHNVVKMSSEPQTLFCFATHANLYVQVFQKDKLIFGNSFLYQNKQDFVYYILNIYDKLFLNPETVPMILTGEPGPNSETSFFLQKYIRKVGPLPANTAFSYSYLFNKIEIQRFYHIFNTIPCVLLEEFGKAGE